MLIHLILIAEVKKAPGTRTDATRRAELLVTLRRSKRSYRHVVHRSSTLELSQRAVPFNQLLDKIGEQTPSDVKHVYHAAEGTEIDELDKKKTREQLLDRPVRGDRRCRPSWRRGSYEPMAGRSLPFARKAPSSPRTSSPSGGLRYEEEIIDSNYKRLSQRVQVGASLALLEVSSCRLRQPGTVAALRPQQVRGFQPFKDRVGVAPQGCVGRACATTERALQLRVLVQVRSGGASITSREHPMGVSARCASHRYRYELAA